MNKPSVLISGGSGLVGRSLTQYLLKKRFEVKWLSTRASDVKAPLGVQVLNWNTDQHTINIEIFKSVEIIINLAGQNIAGKKWSEQYKEKIIKSRIDSSITLIKGLKDSQANIKQFIGASAVGYYGMKIDTNHYAENGEAGNDFLANTCSIWEDSYEEFYKLSKYVAVLRLGLVLSNEGGFYPKIAKSFKFGLGTSLSPGNQIMPIVHVDDVTRAIIYLINHPQKSSVFNLVSDIQPTYDGMAKKMAKYLRRPLWPFSVPSWLLKLILGEQYKMLTTGVHISNEKIKQTGFQFNYADLEEALKNLR